MLEGSIPPLPSPNPAPDSRVALLTEFSVVMEMGSNCTTQYSVLEVSPGQLPWTVTAAELPGARW